MRPETLAELEAEIARAAQDTRCDEVALNNEYARELLAYIRDLERALESFICAAHRRDPNDTRHSAAFGYSSDTCKAAREVLGPEINSSNFSKSSKEAKDD